MRCKSVAFCLVLVSLPLRLTLDSVRIINPLSGLSRDALGAKVDKFCDNYGFQAERDLFYRGALAAQHPNDYERLSELSTQDKAALGEEVTHKWTQSGTLWFSVAMLSLGSMIQGWVSPIPISGVVQGHVP